MDQGLAKVKCPKCLYANAAEQEVCVKCRTPLPRVRVAVPLDSQPPAAPRSAQDPNLTLRPGSVLAERYKVMGVIGRGGMGCIYRVHDSILHEDVALKTLLPQYSKDQQIVERFRNEARIARQLSHPGIVRVHDIGFAGPMLYISMEYVKGMSLRSQMDGVPAGQRLPIKTIMKVFDQLCAALEYAHQFTVHRDIKPENIMVSEDGRVRLMDFGISKLMSNANLTATSMVMGTPHYMSPEQLRDSGSVDARADIYSLGVLLYEVLTGKLPVGMAKPASQVFSEVPPALDVIVTKCLEQDPAARYQNVAELRLALRPIYDLVMSGSTVTGAMIGGVRDVPWKRGLGIALILAVLSGALWGVVRIEKQRRAADIATEIPDPGAEVSLVQVATISQQIEALVPIVELARSNAKSDLGDDDVAKEIFDAAETNWSRAQELGKENKDEALRYTRYALHGFVGPLAATQSTDMVFVPPDEAFGEAGYGFLIGAKEVTCDRFMRFASGIDPPWPARVAATDIPMTGVTVYDALAYAAHNDLALPTETQWLRAAGLAHDAQAFPWGDEWDDEAACVAMAGDESNAVSPAGLFEKDRSKYGCYDIVGNVSELTRTPWRETEDASREQDANADPFGFVQGGLAQSFVVRGGNFREPAEFEKGGARVLRWKERFPVHYNQRDAAIGFRCVKELPMSFAAIDRLVRGESGSAESETGDEPAESGETDLTPAAVAN
jgi:hypothetical protein